MIDGVATLFADLLTAMVQITVSLLRGIIQLAAYVVSRSYRDQVNFEYRQRSPVRKWFDLILISLGALFVGVVIYAVVTAHRPSPAKDDEGRAVKLIEGMIKEFKKDAP